jgi:hypothetical protein
MTTLNATPTTATLTGTGTVPAIARLIPEASARTAESKPEHGVDLHVKGAGGSTSAAIDGPRGMTAIPTGRTGAVVPLDAFSRQSGPDASIRTESGIVAFHAVFQIDAKTRELTVAVVDQDGNLIRMIPSESVARMITAMAAYRGR